MTLLSIREQEAVKRTMKSLELAAMLNEDPTLSRARTAFLKAVILATRDAIARQVRERAEGYKSLTPFTVAHDLATFIEEMRCE